MSELRPSVDVIVSAYERPEALEAVLRSLAAQTYRRFQVVVADDGSGPRIRELAERWDRDSGLRVRHIWHEDRGFRLASIRNRAAAATDGEYLLFVDGDCVMRPDFMERHAHLAQSGHFVHGSRIRLSRQLSEVAISSSLPIHLWSGGRWLPERLRGRIDRFAPLLRLPLGRLRHANPRGWQGVKGCNLAVWREDFLAVNGFDESYEGWGLEDNDLVVRLVRHGVRRKEGRYAVPVLHLWHEEREAGSENLRLLDELLGSDAVRAERGVDRHFTLGSP